jgi:hypothetical protein
VAAADGARAGTADLAAADGPADGLVAAADTVAAVAAATGAGTAAAGVADDLVISGISGSAGLPRFDPGLAA